MKKQRNHSQLKDQGNSPERTNNETDLFSLIDTEFKKEIIKILKKFRTIDRNADYFNKGTRKYKEEPRKRKFMCQDES